MRIVTHNKNKYMEYRELFERENIEIEWINLEYPEIQADELEEIVKFSINYLIDRIEKPFFIEDAGLFIKTLNGFPGPYSSYVHKKIGNRGILKLMENKNNRDAEFRAVIGYYDGSIHIFSGSVMGKISFEEKGKNGFGYDPIFVPEGSNKTFAQMDIDEKNNFSHRRKAWENFLNGLKNIK